MLLAALRSASPLPAVLSRGAEPPGPPRPGAAACRRWLVQRLGGLGLLVSLPPLAGGILSGMNDFAKLLAGQLGADLRTLPQRVRTRLSAEGQAARAGTIGQLREAARRRVPAVV